MTIVGIHCCGKARPITQDCPPETYVRAETLPIVTLKCTFNLKDPCGRRLSRVLQPLGDVLGALGQARLLRESLAVELRKSSKCGLPRAPSSAVFKA